jgi:hypothetical protein
VQDSAYPQYRHFPQSDSMKTDASDEAGRSVCPSALESVRITGCNEFAGDRELEELLACPVQMLKSCCLN